MCDDDVIALLVPLLTYTALHIDIYMDKYEYKMMFACTNDEETRVWDMGEANNADLVTDFLNDQEVINMRKEAGVDLESSEVLSTISKHKIWK